MKATHHTEYVDERLQDTQLAFDRVAPTYDGPRGNNVLIQRMRRTMWATVTATFSPGAKLADLGCGTGLDAAFLGHRGYRIVALDWSPEMVCRTRSRIEHEKLQDRVTTRHAGIHELDALDDDVFDGMYSNLGALNCVEDLEPVASDCARRLRAGGRLVVSVIGRVCPWEMAFYLLRGRPRRAFVRLRRHAQPVNLNGGTVWTRYYTPHEFYRPFESGFTLSYYRGLALFSPPPYLVALQRRVPSMCDALARIDDRLADRPVLRNAGDHFLMVLTKRG